MFFLNHIQKIIWKSCFFGKNEFDKVKTQNTQNAPTAR